MEQQKNYKTYEYMTVAVRCHNANEAADRYASLGWLLERQSEGVFSTTLTFKRDRNIKNKEQLNRLQVRIEDGVNRIAELEQSKKKGASIFSIILGSIAALIFGGGMSLAMFNFEPLTLWAVIVGIALGIAGGALAAIVYPIYTKLVKKQTAKMTPIIEKKRDELYDFCMEANSIVVAA